MNKSDSMIEINDLHVYVDNKEVIKGINLKIKNGTTLAVMGPNGSGKTSLSYALAGHPSYNVKGEIMFKGKNIIDLKPEERAKLGIFLSFQSPPFLEGVTVQQLLKKAYVSRFSLDEQDINIYRALNEEINKALEILNLSRDFLKREVNKNFSGGEKKKTEMLQMLILKPDLAIIDEIDSGLDVDSLKAVANAINNLKDKNRIFIIITHYNRILNYVKPNKVIVIKDGKIAKSDGPKLAAEIEKKGYSDL
jgi:Fe-S cluster assembly ATP-binding protein